MPSARRPSPGPGPIGLAPAEGLPWVRVVTGVVALGISLAIGGQAGWRGAAGATIRPLPMSIVSGEPLPPLPPLARPNVPPDAAASAPSLPLAAVPRSPLQQAAAWQARPAQRHASPVVKVTVARAAIRRVAHRPPAAKVHAAGPRRLAHLRPLRRRIDVRNEFLAAREQVTALTREDSGSMWLARAAARARTARAPARHQLAAHAGARGSLRS